MVEASEVDTVSQGKKLELIKKYALTQFDSGQYVIPRQLVMINEAQHLTDSFQIKVNDVVLIPEKEPYEIKDSLDVQYEINASQLLVYIIIGLVLFGGLVFLIVYFIVRKMRKGKAKDFEEEIIALPPFEKATKRLNRLSESRYLMQADYKSYYSDLIEVFKLYIEEELGSHAQEKTSDELLELVEMLNDASRIKLKKEELKEMSAVLGRSDMSKFAKMNPETFVAEKDKDFVSAIIKNIKDSLPVEQEEADVVILEDGTKVSRKKANKVLFIVAACLLGILALGGISIGVFGWETMKTAVIGNANKNLLEKQWYLSEYGLPGLEIETPEILVREATYVNKKEKAGFNIFQIYLGS